MKLRNPLIVCLLASLFCLATPAIAFAATSLNGCLQNNICASNLVSQGIIKAPTVASTAPAVAVQKNVGLGLVATYVAAEGINQLLDYTKDRALEEDRYLGPEVCTASALLVYSSTGNTARSGAYYGLPIELRDGRWGYTDPFTGMWSPSVRESLAEFTPYWECDGPLAIDADPQLLQEAATDYTSW